MYLGHITMVGRQVALASCLQEVVATRKSKLRLVDLHHVQVRVAIIRANPEVDQDARVVPLPHEGDDHLEAGWGRPLPVGESHRPASELCDRCLQRRVVQPDDGGHVDAALVEVLRLVADVRVLGALRFLQEALQDDLELVAKDVEGRNTAAVLGNDVLAVPVATSELEEVITGVGGPVHRAKKGRGCLDALWGQADRGRPARC